MHTHAEIKRLVVGDRKPSQSPRLFLSEHDGELYATNSYWLTPAAAVRPLLEHNNLPTDKPGVFEVNSKLTAMDLEPPNVGALMPTHTSADDIQRSRLNGDTGAPLFIKPGARLLALFERIDPDRDEIVKQGHVAFDAEYLAFIDHDGQASSIPCNNSGGRVSEIVYRQSGAGKPLAVYAKQEKKAESTYDASNPYGSAKWEDDGELFLGLLMPVRI